jgi:conjugative transfer signal peptidase TraF
MNRHRYRSFLWALFTILFLLTLGEVSYFWGYRVNFTSSVPPGIWKCEKSAEPLKRGDYVCVDTAALICERPEMKEAHKRGYFAYTLFLRSPFDLLKEIGALPGDLVDYDPTVQRVVINGEIQAAGVWMSADSKGRVMPRPRFPYRVPSGEYWLSSSERGFDSRYFGSVPEKCIKSRMVPVFVWR